jgi:hypothetical protein
MPDMAGLELQRELTAQQWPLPVIFLTSPDDCYAACRQDAMACERQRSDRMTSSVWRGDATALAGDWLLFALVGRNDFFPGSVCSPLRGQKRAVAPRPDSSAGRCYRPILLKNWAIGSMGRVLSED